MLAAGGPGELYETTVYPERPDRPPRPGLPRRAGGREPHRIAVRPGHPPSSAGTSPARTCRSSRASSAPTPTAAIEREFLTPYFPTMRKMATNIFLKGYQWPFDPQRIAGDQSAGRLARLPRDGQNGPPRVHGLPAEPRRPGRHGTASTSTTSDPRRSTTSGATGALQERPSNGWPT